MPLRPQPDTTPLWHPPKACTTVKLVRPFLVIRRGARATPHFLMLPSIDIPVASAYCNLHLQAHRESGQTHTSTQIHTLTPKDPQHPGLEGWLCLPCIFMQQGRCVKPSSIPAWDHHNGSSPLAMRHAHFLHLPPIGSSALLPLTPLCMQATHTRMPTVCC